MVEQESTIPGGATARAIDRRQGFRAWFKTNWKDALLIALIVISAYLLASWIYTKIQGSPEVSALKSQIATYQARNTDLLSSINAKDGVIANQNATIQKLQQATGTAPAAGSAAAVPATITRMVSQTQAIEVLRQTFPEAAIRGPERTQYGIPTLAEFQKFIAADNTNNLVLGASSDYVLHLAGAIKQPGWDMVASGFVKPTRTNPLYFISMVDIQGTTTIVGVDAKSDKVWPIAQDLSADFLVVLN